MNINLNYLPIEKLKTTSIGAYIHRPLREEDASKNAILPYVLRQGCKLCPDRESVAKYLENLYGAGLAAGITKIGDDHVLRFEAVTIADKYSLNNEPLVSELLKLLLSIMFEPVTDGGGFVKEVVDIEKNNARDRILSVINDKRVYAMKRCEEEMCGGESFAVSQYGTVEAMDKITPQSLYEYYREIITSSVIDIYVCGTADMDELQKTVDAVTAGMTFKPAEITKAELHENSGEIKNITEKMDVTQGKLSMGFTTGVKPDDDDLFALMVMNSVFGAGAHSKLFNNVREKLSLAYYASSSLVKAKGLLTVNAGIEFENYQKAYDEILAQLKAIQEGVITDTEFNSSVNAILNALESQKDDAAQLHGFAVCERVYGTNHSIDYVKDMIKKVTVGDVVRVSKNVRLDTVYFLTGKGDK